MSDVHTKKVRSYNMSKIKSKNTKPEIIVRKFLYSNGFHYRIHDKRFPGKPDIVLPKYKTVIFVHGCFWHKHNNCKYFVVPKTRTQWWLDKIKKNVENDQKHYMALKDMGLRIITIWECELRPKKLDETLKKLLVTLKK